MTIRALHLLPYRLPLRQEWKSALGSFNERTGWLVCLEITSGQIGYGDCAPLPQARTEPPGLSERWLQKQLSSLIDKDVETALAELPPPDSAPPAARCGLETALLDLSAKQAGITLNTQLCPTAATTVPTNAIIGALGSNTKQHVHEALHRGFNILKLEVGLAGVDKELAQLQALATGLPANCQLRLDANLAWSEENALQFISGLEGLPIESLEEPLQEPNLTTFAKLQQKSPCSLALDESLGCQTLDQFLEKKPTKQMVLKPMVQGGLIPCLDIARQAHDAGIKAIINTTVDSTAGVWAATQLAAAINGQDPSLVHGLATSEWLSKDLGTAPTITNGEVRLPATPGLGFEPSKAWLASLPHD